MEKREEKTDLEHRGNMGSFSYTPFSITIESDGRKGRLYVENQHAKHFTQFTEFQKSVTIEEPNRDSPEEDELPF